MKQSRLAFVFGCVLALIVVLWVYLRWSKQLSAPKQERSEAGVVTASPPSPTGSPVSTPLPVKVPTAEEITERKQQQITLSYLTPISVYGRVIDENGNPIPGAVVQIHIADRPLHTGSDYTETADANGFVSLTGVRGIAFGLVASKQGYYSTEESRGHRNVVVPANGDAPQPTKEQPVILVLRKQGLIEPLIAAESGQITVPSGGQPVNVDLVIGRPGAAGEANLQLASWIGNATQRPFDWRYQLSIPGGGLIERNGRFSFEAPLEGYKSTMEVSMPATAAKWTFSVEKEYFAKLPEGRYARFSIRFYPGRRNFVVIQSYVNPKAGSRNLEYDPSKQASAR